MLAGGLFVDIAGLELTAEDRDILRHPLVSGVTLFTRNYLSPEQLQRLTANIHAIKPQLIIGVDHEGGRVQRFREGFTPIPAAAAFGALYDKSSEQAIKLTQQTAWLMASELLACGVDVSYAPILDLQNLASRVIADRAFHADPRIVTILAEHYINGMHAAGMSAVGKHFPGHGTVLADSHVADPVDDRNANDIMHYDLLPFVNLVSHVEGIMPAHVIYPAIDAKPASFSAYWLKTILRDQLKFTGVIFSDDLSMQAAAKIGDYPARFRAAMLAGCNIGLVCNNRAGVIAILDDVKDVSPQTEHLTRFSGKSGYSYNELLQSRAWQAASEALRIWQAEVSNAG